MALALACPAYAQDDDNPAEPPRGCEGCTDRANAEFRKTRTHVEDQFKKHREWVATTFFRENVLPALMKMTEQLSTVTMQQAQIIGSFFDAEQQMETQRLFQQMEAAAHKDYQPSEGVCKIGTAARSLASSERNAELAASAIAARATQRNLRAASLLSEKVERDKDARLEQYKKIYCNPADQGNELKILCGNGGPKIGRRNKDVDYTRTVEVPLTIGADFTNPGPRAPDDAEDIFALSSNLYGHNIISVTQALANQNGEPNPNAVNRYLDIRALQAKRSVAHNSFAAIAAMKTQGSAASAPYMKELLKELSIPDEDITSLLGDKPSYFAQMEVLTKKLYQNPAFYTELYDKPANVQRKGAALQAIELMQDRDLYRSLLRSEAMLSVLLESQLMREQRAINPVLKGSGSTSGAAAP